MADTRCDVRHNLSLCLIRDVVFADGPKPAAEIEAAAEAAAISARALLFAADMLDVRAQHGQWWLRG